MTAIRKLIYSFSSEDIGATARAVVEQGLTPVGRPEELEIDMQSVPVDDDWVDTLVAGLGKRPSASWHEMVDAITLERDGVRGLTHEFELEPAALVRRLGRIPFTVASFATFHDWSYRSPSLGDGHHRLGWGCAFQGAGHARVVSRRWLATGPSRLLRGPNDTTLVQFHDFAVGMDEARAQAESAHADLLAGFLARDHRFATELAGLHKGNDRSLVFVVHRRVVSAAELYDAAAARWLQPLGPEKPVDKVVYVFIDRAEAEEQLPLLTRYGHHVHLIEDDGVERRIDDAYAPRVERPAWTQRDAAEEPAAPIVLRREPVSLSAEAIEAVG
ncbi:MAG: hypothetical protein IT374_03600, partial [Polyangiaceae bacterium]|nr:hypothetical protein [Polyangiaceae bacterium]